MAQLYISSLQLLNFLLLSNFIDKTFSPCLIQTAGVQSTLVIHTCTHEFIYKCANHDRHLQSCELQYHIWISGDFWFLIPRLYSCRFVLQGSSFRKVIMTLPFLKTLIIPRVIKAKWDLIKWLHLLWAEFCEIREGWQKQGCGSIRNLLHERQVHWVFPLSKQTWKHQPAHSGNTWTT